MLNRTSEDGSGTVWLLMKARPANLSDRVPTEVATPVKGSIVPKKRGDVPPGPVRRMAHRSPVLGSVARPFMPATGVPPSTTLTLAKNWSATLGYTADIRSHDKLASRVMLSLQTGF